MKLQTGALKVRRTRSIGFRISLFVSLAIVIFGFMAVFFASNRQERMYRTEKYKQWSILVNALTPNLMNLLASNNRNTINDILNELTSENEEFHHLCLTNEHQEILYSTEKGRDGSKLTAAEKKSFKAGFRKDETTGVEVVQFDKSIRSGASNLGSLYVGYNYMASLEKERMASILTLENAIQGAVNKYLVEMDFYQVNFITKETIKGIADIAYFKVVTADGIIVSSPKDKEILQPTKSRYDLEVLAKINIRRPVLSRKLYLEGRPVLEVSLGIFDNEHTIGMIEVGYDMSSLNTAQMRGKLLLALIAFVSVALAVGISMYIASRISRPVVHLMRISSEVGSGNLDVEARVDSGGDEMRLLGRAYNQMIEGLKERNMIKDTFSRYVSKQVAEELLKDPEKISLGGEYREATILFSDIRGFTTLSEMLPAEKVVEVLNEYFNVMVEVVFEYEGTLDKYIGDAIMAVFGSPTAHADDPLRAAKTALKMRESLEKLNRHLYSHNLPLIKIGIGINTGKVIAGNIGHIQRMEYTVIGDNVNLASRIEGLTKNYNCYIIITDSTYERIRNEVEVKKLGAVTVKGKTQAVKIYELLDLKQLDVL